MKTMEIEGKEYEVIGTHEDGLPILRGVATPVHHKDKEGNQIFDAEGNPKVSVNINVPAANLFAAPGENGE